MKKACKNCKIFVEGDECTLCKGSQFSTIWRGRLSVLDANKSEIAKKIGLNSKGEYVIKVG